VAVREEDEEGLVVKHGVMKYRVFRFVVWINMGLGLTSVKISPNNSNSLDFHREDLLFSPYQLLAPYVFSILLFRYLSSERCKNE
jgi:hypothetical protein